MSTAGKVLTVLILLVMMGWIVMISAVTQLNVNWETRIQKQDKDLETATNAVAKAIKDIDTFTESAKVEQVNTDRDIREIQGRIFAAEARQSNAIERLERVKFDVAGYLVAVEKANTNLTTRDSEKAKALDDIAKKKDEIAKSQSVNAELREELAKLQTEFKQLLAENLELTTKAASKPVAKPASDRRPIPSS